MSELSIPGTNLRSFIFRKLPAILTPISDIITAKSNIFFTSKRLPWMIIFLGVALRLAQYLANEPVEKVPTHKKRSELGVPKWFLDLRSSLKRQIRRSFFLQLLPSDFFYRLNRSLW